MESHSGMNEGLRLMCTTLLKYIAKSKNGDISVYSHNFHVRMSIFYQKQKI